MGDSPPPPPPDEDPSMYPEDDSDEDIVIPNGNNVEFSKSPARNNSMEEPRGHAYHRVSGRSDKKEKITVTAVDYNKNNVDDKMPDKDPEGPVDPMVVQPSSYFAVFRYAKPFDFLFIVIGIVGSIITGAAMPSLFILFGDLVDQMIQPMTDDFAGGGDNVTMDPNFDPFEAFEDEVATICINFTIIGCVVFVSAYFQITYITIAGENILYRLRKRVFKAVMRQDIGWFDYQKTGKLVTRLADDLEKVRQGLSDKIAICLQHTSTFIVSFIIAFWYGPKMAAVMSCMLPPLALVGLGFAKMSESASSDEQEEYGEAGAIAEYTMSSIRTVVAFGGERREINNYNSKLGHARWIGIKKATLSGLFLGSAFLFMFCGYGLAFWYGPKQIEDGDMEVNEVLIVFFSVLIGAMSLGEAAPVFSIVSSGSGAFSFINAILKRNPPIDASSDKGKVLDDLKGHICVKNVSFRYDTRPDVPILKNVSMEVTPGQTVALVGASGSGKSTIVNLLQRFYDIQAGTITIDGVDLKELNVKWLRKQIGIVSQEPVLFGCSIKENIKYGREVVTDEDIDRAIREANAFEFIKKLPKGLDTIVGERGSQLSGGQKQRIAIARALVRNPRILLLDEATSALDSASERIVQDALDRARSGRTTLVVAHRLSTIKDADLIIAMEKGEVIDVGTHDQLIADDGLYADLVRAQNLAAADEKAENTSDGVDASEDASRTRKVTESEEVHDNHHGEEGAGAGKAKKFLCFNKKEKDPNEQEPPSMFAVLRLNKPEWPFILVACIFAFGSAGAMPLFAIFFAEMMEVFALPPDEVREEAIRWALLFVMLGFVTGGSMLMESWSLGVSGNRMTERLRSVSFKSMVQQDMSFFDDESNYVGALTTRLAKDASLVQGASGVRLKASLEAVCGMLVGLVIAFVFGWQLALLILAAVPIIGVTGGIQMKFAQGFQMKESEDNQAEGKVVTEAISNVRTVHSLTLESRLYSIFLHSLHTGHRKNLCMAHLFGAAQSVSQSVIFFMYAGAFRFAAWLVAEGHMESADTFRVIFALVFAAFGVGQSMSILPDYAKAQAATLSIQNLIDTESKINNLSSEGKSIPKSVSGEIELRDVHFRYPSRPKVKILRGVSLKIEQGKTVALVGPSGCGKSTIMQLLLRFYDPEQGQVMFGGEDIKALNVRELRRQMAIVQQEPVLFNTSIRQNILYGALTDAGQHDSTVTELDVIDAAKAANIHEFIVNLPQGYDTNVGEKGAQLSGGQKQRVAIARALIRQPKVLLFDEATSALDSESEKVVQRALDQARVGRTCIIIAHRLTTIQNADEIVVVDNGEIVQRGTHETLSADQAGLYAKFCKSQKLARD